MLRLELHVSAPTGKEWNIAATLPKSTEWNIATLMYKEWNIALPLSLYRKEE